MQFKTLFTASLLSGIAAAAPKATCTSEPKAQATGSDAPKAFGLVALRSASPIHFASFSASQSGFDLKLPKDKQGAKCDGKDEGTATFTIKDGELFLYSSGKEQQIAYTDRSGMGQGVLQYTSGDSYPRNAETKGWKIDDAGNLVFGQNNASFIACDNGVDGSWSVWVSAGVSQPGNTDAECLGFNARVAEIEKPVSCKYSEYSA